MSMDLFGVDQLCLKMGKWTKYGIDFHGVKSDGRHYCDGYGGIGGDHWHASMELHC